MYTFQYTQKTTGNYTFAEGSAYERDDIACELPTLNPLCHKALTVPSSTTSKSLTSKSSSLSTASNTSSSGNGSKIAEGHSCGNASSQLLPTLKVTSPATAKDTARGLRRRSVSMDNLYKNRRCSDPVQRAKCK